MGIESIATIMGVIGAGTSTAGSLYNAASGGNSSGVKASFPQAQQAYLNSLAGGGGLGETSMTSLTNLASTGGSNNTIEALTKALSAKQDTDRAKGTANILEQMGANGARFSTPTMTALGDFESQLGENYGNVLAQYVYNATESGLNRQLSAAQTGAQLFSQPALAQQGTISTPGASIASLGTNLGSIGTYLGSLTSSKTAASKTSTNANNYGFAAGLTA
jgi:hypothetical protein